VKRWYCVADGTHAVPVWATDYEAVVSKGIKESVRGPWGRSEEDLMFLYTGGTTGMPKGVMWRQYDLFHVLGLGGNPALGVPGAKSIEEIIDHHVDAGQYLQCNGKYRNIAWNINNNTATVASTCTLVGEYYLSEDKELLDSDISTLLMGVISLDTYNMDPTVGKGTNRDQIIYDELQKRCLQIGIDRNELFNNLINAKTDIMFWRSLHPSDQLILDYKLFESSSRLFGMSSVLLPVIEFINHIDALTVIDDYLKQNNDNTLDILVVMSFVTTPTPTRELLLLSHSEHRLQEIFKFIDTKLFLILL
jgi:inorganic pyrophosphatase/exopolyphosphatase